MGRIVNNNNQNFTNWGDDDFLRDICLGQYVLVLGDDVILKEAYGAGNSSVYIRQECVKELEAQNINASGLDLKPYVRRMLRTNWEYNTDEMSESLVKLIRTKFFPLVLTTTFDGYVEKLMREVYGDSLNVVNFSENKGAIQYNKEYNVLVPTLFYVFGKAEKNCDFALSEDDYMTLLCKWMDKSTRPNELIEYLRTKKILAIGGKYENWYFRFFWYSLRQSLVAGQRKGDIAISLENDNECRLSDFLLRNEIENHEDHDSDNWSPRIFLDSLSRQLSDTTDETLKAIHAARQLGGVFILYAHEDYPIVCQIYGVLCSLEIPVWFDNKKLNNYAIPNDYDVRIENAISSCKVFLPILSRQVKDDLVQNNDRYYKDIEWNKALNNKECSIMPLALFGFDKRRDVNLLPNNIFGGKNIIDWAIDGEGGLVKALKL